MLGLLSIYQTRQAFSKLSYMPFC